MMKSTASGGFVVAVTVAIGWIILDRFEWSGNWVVVTPNLPSVAPHSTPAGPGVWMSMSTTTAQGHPSRGPPVNVGLHRGD
jgi:hypothetical protein